MITLEEIKQDIADGKVRAIYYSSQTLWWTHLEEDVTEATKIGQEASRISHQKFLARPDVPESEKKRMDSLVKRLEQSKHQVPLDVTGSPLFMFTEKEDIDKWIATAEQKPEHFGKHGLLAFVKAHHRNCDNVAYPQWRFYNHQIDIETPNTL